MNAVVAVGKALHLLHSVPEIRRRSVQQVQLSVIFDSAAGKTASLRVIIARFARRKRDRKKLPVNHVVTDGVPPVHAAPESAVRIMLVKNVVFSFEENKAIRIIHPAGLRHEVIVLPHAPPCDVVLTGVNFGLRFLDIQFHPFFIHFGSPGPSAFHSSGRHSFHNKFLRGHRNYHHRKTE